MNTKFLFTPLIDMGAPAALSLAFLIVIACILCVFFLSLKSLRKKLAHQKELGLLTAKNKINILRAEMEAQEQTFRRISAEVHDNVGQQLSLAIFHAQKLTEQGTDAAEITTILKRALADLRDLSHSLNGEIIREQGLQATIRGDVERLRSSGKIDAEFTEGGIPAQLDADTSVLLYRIIQEAMQNVLKHAKASKLKIFMSTEDGVLGIAVFDNGRGFPNIIHEGTGFKNMRARAQALGGRIKLDTNKKGAAILIEIPVNHAKD